MRLVLSSWFFRYCSHSIALIWCGIFFPHCVWVFFPWEFYFALVGVYFLAEINLNVGLFVGIVSPTQNSRIAYILLKDAISTNRTLKKMPIELRTERDRQWENEPQLKGSKSVSNNFCHSFFCGFSGIKFSCYAQSGRSREQTKQDDEEEKKKTTFIHKSMFVFLLRN